MVSLTGTVSAQLIAEVRTSKGNFSINLHYLQARRTVSHFMRLANGVQPWMDVKTGKLMYGVKFYEGLKFYKPYEVSTLKNYIQAGSRSNAELDSSYQYAGAGYVLRDEIRYDALFNQMLIPHTQWTVSMANRAPHSSSSQFLITLVNDASFNGKNSAFGTVNQLFIDYDYPGGPRVTYNGWAVVTAINNSFQPVIYNITFRRLNQTAIDFDENEYIGEVPVMGEWPITSLTHDETEVHLGYPPLQAAEMRMYSSLDLLEWTYFPYITKYVQAGLPSSPPMSFLHGNGASLFCRLTATRYPVTAVPDPVTGLYGKMIEIGAGTGNRMRFYFGQYGITNTYVRYVPTQVAGEFEYTFTSKGPYHAELVITSPASIAQTYRLYFGGTDLNTPHQPGRVVYDTMRALIKDGPDWIDSHFSITETP